MIRRASNHRGGAGLFAWAECAVFPSGAGHARRESQERFADKRSERCSIGTIWGKVVRLRPSQFRKNPSGDDVSWP